MEKITAFIKSQMPANGELEAAHKEHVDMMTREIAMQKDDMKTRKQYDGYWKSAQRETRVDAQSARAEKTPVSAYSRALQDFYSTAKQ